jgi:hypothetical protein
MIAFETATLRSNPGYEAVPLNRLTPAERQSLTTVQPGVASAADSYGVLVPSPGSGLMPVVICRETALLFLTLQSPGPAPDYVLAAPGGEGQRVLQQLLLDRVLEIEGPAGFVTGADACGLLGLSSQQIGAGALAELSQAALRYAAALQIADAPTLARKLYGYNRRPTTPGVRRRLATPDAVADFLGLGADGANRDIVDAGWTTIEGGEGWLQFAARPSGRDARGITCKLYVGLDMDALATRFGAIVDVLAHSEASQFKVGADLGGLLRSDKMVAYFPSKDTLLAAAQALTPVVAGQRVQAVPFTAEIAAGGALSWGSDPAAGGSARMSWRQWICERLAIALATARLDAAPEQEPRETAAGGIEPWSFALQRLRLDGVDPQTFMPMANWSEAAA